MTANQPPILVAAFEGWNDAGNAASALLDALLEEWEAEPFHEMDPQDYYDFQVNRPVIERDEDGGRRLLWPGTVISRGHTPSGREAVLVRGLEPSFRWRDFVDEILAVAQEEGVQEIFLLGALLADVPHTRHLPTTGTSSVRRVRRTLGLRESEYEGPTGIVGVLDATAGAAGFDPVSVWVSVPHYVSDPPSPKATLALATELASHLDEPISVSGLAEEAQRWEENVSELASENPDVAGYVAQLERNRDTTEAPEASGEAIAREFERYLRRQEKGRRDKDL